MGTYRTGRYKHWDGTIYYKIERKTFFGWKVVKRWIVSEMNGLKIIRLDSDAKAEMMEAVERLEKAGHTVI